MPADEPVDGVLVTSDPGVRYAQRIRTGVHELMGDEPASLGGGDAGPTPYDLLLAALGTCMSITIQLYTDRKGWEIGTVRVHLKHHREHGRDCEECEMRRTSLDIIDVNLQVDGDLSTEQRDRIYEIAQRCPVHATLTSPFEIRTHMA